MVSAFDLGGTTLDSQAMGGPCRRRLVPLRDRCVVGLCRHALIRPLAERQPRQMGKAHARGRSGDHLGASTRRRAFLTLSIAVDRAGADIRRMVRPRPALPWRSSPALSTPGRLPPISASASNYRKGETVCNGCAGHSHGRAFSSVAYGRPAMNRRGSVAAKGLSPSGCQGRRCRTRCRISNRSSPSGNPRSASIRSRLGRSAMTAISRSMTSISRSSMKSGTRSASLPRVRQVMGFRYDEKVRALQDWRCRGGAPPLRRSGTAMTTQIWIENSLSKDLMCESTAVGCL